MKRWGSGMHRISPWTGSAKWFSSKLTSKPLFKCCQFESCSHSNTTATGKQENVCPSIWWWAPYYSFFPIHAIIVLERILIWRCFGSITLSSDFWIVWNMICFPHLTKAPEIRLAAGAVKRRVILRDFWEQGRSQSPVFIFGRIPLARVLLGCPQPGSHGNRCHVTKSQTNLGKGGELAP